MKGLLLKDIYTLIRQMKIFLGIIVIFACLPGYSVSAIALMYAALLPITALGYDERCHWDTLAQTMPYTTRDMVLSKYMLGYGGAAAAAVLSLAVQTGLQLIRPETENDPLELLVMLCVSWLMLAVNLPFMFRFGVEKGRIFFFVIIGAFVAASVVLEKQLPDLSAVNLSLPSVLLLAAAFTVALSAVSVWLSLRGYHRRYS